jgi:hypothetical protein
MYLNKIQNNITIISNYLKKDKELSKKFRVKYKELTSELTTLFFKHKLKKINNEKYIKNLSRLNTKLNILNYKISQEKNKKCSTEL